MKYNLPAKLSVSMAGNANKNIFVVVGLCMINETSQTSLFNNRGHFPKLRLYCKYLVW